MEQRCGRVKAYEPIANDSTELMDFLDLVRELVVSANQRGQLGCKERDRFTFGAEDQPSGDWHADHEDVKRKVGRHRDSMAPFGFVR